MAAGAQVRLGRWDMRVLHVDPDGLTITLGTEGSRPVGCFFTLEGAQRGARARGRARRRRIAKISRRARRRKRR